MDTRIIDSLETKALDIAYRAHDGQLRKYTKEPYITHPISVLGILKEHGVTSPIVLSAALLHDVLEDTEVDYGQVAGLCGEAVANLVLEVTDVSRPEDGNRKARKAIDREHLAQASPAGKTIKLADLVHNTSSIVLYDPSFAKVYLKEKANLLQILRGGDISLWQRAAQTLELKS